MLSIEQLQQKIARALEKLPIYGEPDGLYQPISYTLSQGGKRLRPLLTLISTQMFGGDPDKAVPAASAIEIFHNFTLLHDDIIDQAPLRRGRDTVYKKWNTNTAILSGDTMFAIAYGQLATTDAALLSNLMKVFTKTAIEVCEGQQYDIDFEEADNVNIDGYINMIRLKTAVLLAASLKIGAMVAGADDTDAENIYKFGENLGIAFQLQDDLLDAFGDEAIFGKKTGGDIVANKKTFLYLKALETSSTIEAEKLKALYCQRNENDELKIKQVLELFAKADVQKHTEQVIARYYKSAMDCLTRIKLDETAKQPLLKLTNDILKRKF
ncbi:MAG TPA: polyprenyl synthetase family protein [Lentimicrobium sp.]|nr:polyprenyl synthetase family protein [Lentimicrobium sp.]